MDDVNSKSFGWGWKAGAIVVSVAVVIAVLLIANVDDSPAAQERRCVAFGGTWDRGGTAPQGVCVSDNEGACARRGGQWQRVCRAQDLMCVTATKDAGKQCTDESECERRCLYEGATAKPDGAVTGACQRDNDPCGLFTDVIKGRKGATVLMN